MKVQRNFLTFENPLWTGRAGYFWWKCSFGFTPTPFTLFHSWNVQYLIASGIFFFFSQCGTYELNFYIVVLKEGYVLVSLCGTFSFKCGLNLWQPCKAHKTVENVRLERKKWRKKSLLVAPHPNIFRLQSKASCFQSVFVRCASVCSFVKCGCVKCDWCVRWCSCGAAVILQCNYSLNAVAGGCSQALLTLSLRAAGYDNR